MIATIIMASLLQCVCLLGITMSFIELHNNVSYKCAWIILVVLVVLAIIFANRVMAYISS